MPAGVAATVFTLAEKTGWGIDYILWEVPIVILNQANHAFLWTNGADTRRVLSSKPDKVSKIAKMLESGS